VPFLVATIVGVRRGNTDARAGRLLKSRRLSAGLNQGEVAARAGLPQSTVSAYESGRRQPTLPMLSKLLEAMGAELAVEAVPLPEHLAGLTGPIGLRVRRHRQLIVAAATRHGAGDVRVLGAVARGQDGADERLGILVDPAAGSTGPSLLDLAAELEELVGVPVDILTPERLSADRRAGAGTGAVAL
jgi:uncharacterized protein